MMIKQILTCTFADDGLERLERSIEHDEHMAERGYL
jgi:hypothetical protein